MRVAHARLRGEVHHALELLAARTAPPCPCWSARSSFTKRNFGCFLQLREARLLQRDVVVLVEVVEADDLVAARQQLLRDVGADEAGRAGDEISSCDARPLPQSRPSDSSERNTCLMSYIT